jgi:hypothetical protein
MRMRVGGLGFEQSRQSKIDAPGVAACLARSARAVDPREDTLDARASDNVRNMDSRNNVLLSGYP